MTFWPDFEIFFVFQARHTFCGNSCLFAVWGIILLFPTRLQILMIDIHPRNSDEGIKRFAAGGRDVSILLYELLIHALLSEDIARRGVSAILTAKNSRVLVAKRRDNLRALAVAHLKGLVSLHVVAIVER